MKTKQGKEVKTGDIVRFVYYTKVNNINNVFAEPILGCKDLNRGFDFEARGNKLVETVDSADFFTETVKLGRVALADKFVECGDNVFTVVFEKANGTERKLRGYMISKETGLGRSQVIDLDIERDHSKDYDNRIRQVDHRTLKSLIFNGVKYVLK